MMMSIKEKEKLIPLAHQAVDGWQIRKRRPLEEGFQYCNHNIIH